MSPAVSVLIPCYNAQATIVEAIDGLLAQTVEDWECILVSDDGTSYLDLLADHGIRDARLIEHPERTRATGTVAPRNRGMSLVQGACVADLDADDVWKPTRLERLIPLAQQVRVRSGRPGMLFGRRRYRLVGRARRVGRLADAARCLSASTSRSISSSGGMWPARSGRPTTVGFPTW